MQNGKRLDGQVWRFAGTARPCAYLPSALSDADDAVTFALDNVLYVGEHAMRAVQLETDLGDEADVNSAARHACLRMATHDLAATPRRTARVTIMSR